MSVHAYFAIMVILLIRTPDRLEKKHIEVHIDFVFFYQLNRQFTFTVRKGAILLVVTRGTTTLEIRRTEFSLVLIWMVELFHSVMSSITGISSWAILPLRCHLWTNFRLIGAKRASAVLIVVMVEGAAFEIVILGLLVTRLKLKLVQVEKSDGLVHGDLSGVKAAAMGICACLVSKDDSHGIRLMSDLWILLGLELGRWRKLALRVRCII